MEFTFMTPGQGGSDSGGGQGGSSKGGSTSGGDSNSGGSSSGGGSKGGSNSGSDSNRGFAAMPKEKVQEIAREPYGEAFSGGTVAIQVGKEIWVGVSGTGERIAPRFRCRPSSHSHPSRCRRIP